MQTILVIDDEENIRNSLSEILQDEGYTVVNTEKGEKGLQILRQQEIDLVFLDIQLGGMNGMDVLKKIKEEWPGLEVLIISGHGTVENAVEAIKIGAYDFLQKPLSLVKVKLSARHALEKSRQARELKRWKQDQEKRNLIIGNSAAVQRVKEQILKIGPSQGRVLITGESGTGKELVAHAIHQASSRKTGPFIKVNCAAIPKDLIESELFGHEKGAFTGAIQQRRGKFELADGGTLFLDEIGDMEFSTQAKVLRALQEGEFERVGGTQTHKVDVRVIAATNKNLEELVKKNVFRNDLFFRLNVVPFYVPALRERIQDVPILVRHFIEIFGEENNKPGIEFDEKALQLLSRQSFPGNVRELKNLVERLAIMSSGLQIGEKEVLEILGNKTEENTQEIFLKTRSLAQAKEELEKKYVETQLALNEWNISKTAEGLGIQRTNLHRKMVQLGIERRE